LVSFFFVIAIEPVDGRQDQDKIVPS